MEKFVCVRIVQGNALDLTVFQFDYDLTFAVFFLNADGAVYGRYGSRGHRDSGKDIAIQGFREALAGALDLHRAYPGNRDSLRGKQGRPVKFERPEDYPSLLGKFGSKLDYDGSVAKSCIHCHQVRDAERLVYRVEKRAIPDAVLYPYPMPDVLGLRLDPQKRAAVLRVEPGSAAARAGIAAGDSIAAAGGQPLLSVADLQWVLQGAADGDTLDLELVRDGKSRRARVELAPGWRRAVDISWRPTTWDLRRMGTGGLLLEELGAGARDEADIAADGLALLVKHVGQYGEHAVAKNAGFKKDDVIVEIDGKSGRMSETAFLAYSVQDRRAGDRIKVTVLRDGRRIPLELRLQ